MTTLLCVLKWIVAGSAVPCGAGLVLYVCGKLMNAAATTRPSPAPDWLVKAVLGVFLCVGLFWIGLAVYHSARWIMPMFGCDDCLPEAWQEACAATSADALERADKAAVATKVAEIRALCDRWAWPTCPVDAP